MGVLPEALVNYLALLGWAPTGGTREIFSMQDRLSTLTAERLQPDEAAPAPRPAPRLASYELHARGRRLFHRLEKGTLDQAQALIRGVPGNPIRGDQSLRLCL